MGEYADFSIRKTCVQCRETKASIYFYGDKRSSDGLRSSCESCTIAASKLNAARLRSKRLKMIESGELVSKDCYKCRVNKPYDQFYKNSSSNDGFGNVCKSCENERKIKKRRYLETMKPGYKNWVSMRNRCRDMESYKDINICSGIKESFEFFMLILGERPSPKSTVDRIDNEGQYTCGKCPECIEKGWRLNCRWASQKEQTHNRSNSVYYTYNGKTQVQEDWAREFGMNSSSFSYRRAQGWNIEQIAMYYLGDYCLEELLQKVLDYRKTGASDIEWHNLEDSIAAHLVVKHKRRRRVG